MPQPTAVTSTADELIRVYIDAWQRIVAEQERILTDPRKARRRGRLNELRVSVERELNRLDVDTRGWLRTRLPQVYAAGAESTLRTLGEQSLTWTQLHVSAVQRLATDTFNDLLRATEFVRADTKRFVREAAKIASERTLTTGQTAQGAARGLRGLLRERGIASVIYKNGTRHGLAEYAETVLRTKTAVAYNTGTINTAVERGFTTLQIFDGSSCGLTSHDDPRTANGMIVSAEEALFWPISHPRCVRAFSARPDLSPRAARPPVAASSAPAASPVARSPRPARTARTARQPRQRRTQRA